MDPKVKEQWIKALRSKQYKQGQGRLRTTNTTKGFLSEEDRYCCLGVLCDVYDKKFHPNDTQWNYHEGEPHYMERATLLPDRVATWADVNRYSAPAKSRIDRLIALNDKGISFSEIANIIESDF